MSKKLMLLAAGALTALAFAALPALASAAEFQAHCSTVGGTCPGLIAGGAATLEDDSGGAAGKVECASSTGSTSIVDTTSTGTASITFHGCKEEVFGTACTGTGQPAGTIKTGALTAHNILMEASPKVVGVLLTNINVTFVCLGITKEVKGNVIGEITNPNCGAASASHTLVFAKGATAGSQKWTQITTAGTKFDLTSSSNGNDATTTAQQSGTGTVTYSGGAKVTLTC